MTREFTTMINPLHLDCMENLAEPEVCLGCIYRAKVNCFMNKKGEYIYQERMVPMKKLSCPGCKDCGWVEDELSECIACGTPPIIKNIEHDKLYKLAIKNITYDFETGYADGWDLEFIKIEEENND